MDAYLLIHHTILGDGYTVVVGCRPDDDEQHAHLKRLSSAAGHTTGLTDGRFPTVRSFLLLFTHSTSRQIDS